MKITKENFAVVEGDMLLSRYVEEQGRLDVDYALTDLVLPYIPMGGTVVDVGACIGDHTIVYAKAVGLRGMVYAFEPNLAAFECLLYNTVSYPQVIPCDFGLGSWNGKVSIVPDIYNLGATRLVDHGGVKDTSILKLDDMAKVWKRLDFIKIDAEGYEPWILDGGMETLKRFRPVMLIEINDDMLGRNGFTREDVYARIRAIAGYDFGVSAQNSYDLLCLPVDLPEVMR